MATQLDAPQLTDAERIDYLSGFMSSVLALIGSSTMSYPDLPALEEQFKSYSTRLAASAGYDLVSERYLDGQAFGRDRILALIRHARRKRGV